jgi:hypothetical protein
MSFVKAIVLINIALHLPQKMKSTCLFTDAPEELFLRIFVAFLFLRILIFRHTDTFLSF